MTPHPPPEPVTAVALPCRCWALSDPASCAFELGSPCSKEHKSPPAPSHSEGFSRCKQWNCIPLPGVELLLQAGNRKGRLESVPVHLCSAHLSCQARRAGKGWVLPWGQAGTPLKGPKILSPSTERSREGLRLEELLWPHLLLSWHCLLCSCLGLSSAVTKPLPWP